MEARNRGNAGQVADLADHGHPVDEERSRAEDRPDGDRGRLPAAAPHPGDCPCRRVAAPWRSLSGIAARQARSATLRPPSRSAPSADRGCAARATGPRWLQRPMAGYVPPRVPWLRVPANGGTWRTAETRPVGRPSIPAHAVECRSQPAGSTMRGRSTGSATPSPAARASVRSARLGRDYARHTCLWPSGVGGNGSLTPSPRS